MNKEFREIVWWIGKTSPIHTKWFQNLTGRTLWTAQCYERLTYWSKIDQRCPLSRKAININGHIPHYLSEQSGEVRLTFDSLQDRRGSLGLSCREILTKKLQMHCVPTWTLEKRVRHHVRLCQDFLNCVNDDEISCWG